MLFRTLGRLVLAAWFLSIAADASAQSSLQVPVQFDFLNPSARSLALGGAFVGLADDATAALVNPAGLVGLTRKEVSIEGRFRRMTQPFLVGGRLSGTITGKGQDTIPGPDFDPISDSGIGLSFLSVVIPRGRFRFAGFRHELIRLEQDFASRGVFQNHGFDTRDTALSALRTLKVDTYGASAAIEFSRSCSALTTSTAAQVTQGTSPRRCPIVSLGAGILVQDFSLGFEFDRFVHENQDLYGAPDPTQKVFHFSQDGDDVSVGAVVGVVVPVSGAKIGASYKRSPKSEFSSFSGGLVGSQQTTTSTFKVPDSFAVGVSMAFGSAFLITTEYTRVLHSQLFSDYVSVLASRGETRDRLDSFTIDDANEFHLGAEYLAPVKGRPAIRLGIWFDPDHSVHYAPTPANDLLDERVGIALSSGRDLWHYTGGTMLAVHPRMDISAGIDWSTQATRVSASAIIHF
jgi:long-chain fatty acid transport protein